MAVQTLSRLQHATRFEPVEKPPWPSRDERVKTISSPMTPSAPAAGASLALLFQLEMEGREAAKLGCAAPPRQISVVLDRLRALSRPDSNFEARLMRDAQYYSASVLEEEGSMCAVVLASKLAQVGYRVSIRTALGGGAGLKAFAHLSHEFLVVAPPGGQLSLVPEIIVDPHFRDQFDIPQAAPWYRQVVAAVPVMYAGNTTRLKAMVRLVCGEMGAAFSERGTVAPPWRSVKSLLSKWLPTKARDTSVSEALTSSPPSSRRGSGKSPAGASPAAASQRGAAFYPERRRSDVWAAAGRGSELPAAVARTGVAQLADDYSAEAMPVPVHGDSSASGPRGASDSEEEQNSSPDTTLLFPGFPAATDPARKSAIVRLASGFPAPNAHSPSQAPLHSAKSGSQSPPQPQCSSLTLAMRGRDAAAVQPAAASAGNCLLASAAHGPGAGLRSLSEPAAATSGEASAAPAPTVAPETGATVRRASKSLLSSNLAAASGARSPISSGGPPAPAGRQPDSSKDESYTLTTSDAAAIAAAQQHAHPTVRGPAPPSGYISPFAVRQPPTAVAGPTAFASKVAAGHSQGHAFPQQGFNGVALPDSPASDTGPTVDAPFWSQPVIQDYIRVHSQHGSSRRGGLHVQQQASGAAGAQLGGGATEAVPRIRTVKMRGISRGSGEVARR